MSPILVTGVTGVTGATGATGTVGRHLCAALAAAGAPVVAAARRADVTFDWHDPDTWDAALSGIERMYLIAPAGDPEPAAAMRPFLERAHRSGVTRAVLQSSSLIAAGDPGLGTVHALVAEMFPEWAALRPSWFMQNFTGSHVQAAALRTRGELVSATGGGRVGFIDARDIAAVAAAVLLGEALNRDPILTGPEALSYDDVATILGRAAGRTVRHVDVRVDRLRAILRADGMSEDYAAMLAGLDGMIARGVEDRVTSEVADLTGVAPRSLAQFAADTPWW